jgi:antitoxin HigA-1
MRMYNPPYPGEILREDVLPELGLTVTEAARQLGVSRVTLSRILNGRSAITADMADRLGQWLGNGAGIWLRMQTAYDLWQVEHRKHRPKIKPLKRAA